MKELNTFRQFISEEKDKKVSEDKIEAAIKATLEKEGGAAGIDPLKKAVKDLDVDTDFDIEKFLKKMSNVEKHKNGDYILTPLKENDAVLDEVIEEGTWDLGSVAEMEKVLGKLNQIRRMGAARGSVELEDLDNALYRVFGDDAFHDAIDAAKGTDDDDRFNNFMGDAQSRALELYKGELRDAQERGETGREFKPRFGLEENDSVLDEIVDESFIGDLATRIRKRKAAKKEKERFTKGLDMKRGGAPEIDSEFTKGLEENDAVLDEVIEEGNIFNRIDQMMDTIADQMSPDDAFKALAAEFQVVSGGTMMLERALRRMIEDLGLTGDVREEEVEEIRSAYNEEKEDNE